MGEALRFRSMYSSHDTEVPAGACVDYLETRSDVDPERIGIMAVSLGGYYAPRAAAFEKRVSAANGSRSNLPGPADKPETFGSTLQQPRHY